MTDNRYWIPDGNTACLNDRIEKLNKRARKLGCPEIEMKVLGSRIERYTPDSLTPDIERLWWHIEVSGSAPRLADWEFVARLNHDQEGGVMVLAVPGVPVPEEFRQVEPGRCDHCRTDRRRRDTFLVQHADTNEYKVVGRSCLKDFLGHRDPKAITSYFTALDNFVRGLAEGFGGWSYIEYWAPERVLAYACSAVRRYGWQSRSRSYDGGPRPTATIVRGLLYGPPSSAPDWVKAEHRQELKKVTSEDWGKARRILWWAGENLWQTPGLTDYEFNLVVSMTGHVTDRALGVLVSGICAYDRAVGSAVEQAAVKASDYVGEKGKRFNCAAKVVFTKSFEGMYGTKTLVKLVTNEGDTLVWWASGFHSFEIGEQFSVRATVKAHETYRGECQTIVTRAKLTELAA